MSSGHACKYFRWLKMKIICIIKIPLSKSLGMFAVCIVISFFFEGRKRFSSLISSLFGLSGLASLKERCWYIGLFWNKTLKQAWNVTKWLNLWFKSLRRTQKYRLCVKHSPFKLPVIYLKRKKSSISVVIREFLITEVTDHRIYWFERDLPTRIIKFNS